MEYRTFVPGADDAVLKLRANVWSAEHPQATPEFLHWLLGGTPAGAGSGVMMLDGRPKRLWDSPGCFHAAWRSGANRWPSPNVWTT